MYLYTKFVLYSFTRQIPENDIEEKILWLSPCTLHCFFNVVWNQTNKHKRWHPPLSGPRSVKPRYQFHSTCVDFLPWTWPWDNGLRAIETLHSCLSVSGIGAKTGQRWTATESLPLELCQTLVKSFRLHGHRRCHDNSLIFTGGIAVLHTWERRSGGCVQKEGGWGRDFNILCTVNVL